MADEMANQVASCSSRQRLVVQQDAGQSAPNENVRGCFVPESESSTGLSERAAGQCHTGIDAAVLRGHSWGLVQVLRVALDVVCALRQAS